MVRIILNGCNGAMGKMLANIIAQDEQAQVWLELISRRQPIHHFLYLNLSRRVMLEADALIDFTVSKITDMVLDQCAQKRTCTSSCNNRTFR